MSSMPERVGPGRVGPGRGGVVESVVTDRGHAALKHLDGAEQGLQPHQARHGQQATSLDHGSTARVQAGPVRLDAPFRDQGAGAGVLGVQSQHANAADQRAHKARSCPNRLPQRRPRAVDWPARRSAPHTPADVES